jgi:hypothetical protein
MIKIFGEFNFVLSQNTNYFAIFFGENIFKIITSVPDGSNFRLMNEY